ncbi:hypothetical protein [uncultured Weeksella sp.]|uniref:hypothetical protein n=1 Tax=uncultured Weeksella sp. TaxID=1161389 RepID=UPI00259B3F0A|nr:hypothetical protein [uncultured Weeksella sp.]
MKRILYYHVFNLFKFSYTGDNERAFIKSKETFSSHINNLIIIFIIFPLWIIFDGNSFVKNYLGNNKYEIKHFVIILVVTLTLIGFTKINFVKSYINKIYTDNLVDKSLEMYKESPVILNYFYRIIFILFNFFWVIIMFFVELKFFSFFK